MAEDAPDGLVLPRRELLEHLELVGDEVRRELRPAQQPLRLLVGTLANAVRCRRDLRARMLQPQLGRLVHGLEEQLVPVDALLGRLLEREQLVRPQIPLVVRGALAGEDRLRRVLSRDRHRR